MASTAIIVNATDALGKSAQKSVTNVNPAATNAQLVALGQAINAISNNTYGGTVRIDKTDCDTDPTPSGFGKTATQVTITLSAQSFDVGAVAEVISSQGEDQGYFEIGTVTTDRASTDATKFAVFVNNLADNIYLAGYVYSDEGTLRLSDAEANVSFATLVENGIDVTVVALENETYAAGSATAHVAFTS